MKRCVVVHVVYVPASGACACFGCAVGILQSHAVPFNVPCVGGRLVLDQLLFAPSFVVLFWAGWLGLEGEATAVQGSLTTSQGA